MGASKPRTSPAAGRARWWLSRHRERSGVAAVATVQSREEVSPACVIFLTPERVQMARAALG